MYYEALGVAESKAHTPEIYDALKKQIRYLYIALAATHYIQVFRTLGKLKKD